MPDPYDPADRPTEVVRPVRAREPLPPAGVAAAVPAADYEGAFARLADDLRSLRTMVAIVGAIAVLSLAAAIYAITQAKDDGNRGASRADVQRVNDRVSRVVRQLRDVRSTARAGASASGDPGALEDQLADKASASDVASLKDQVAKLASASSGSSDGGDAQAAVDELSSKVDDLSARIDALEKQGSTTP